MSGAENIDTVSGDSTAEVDSIWLTKPSVKPIVLAASLMLAIVGLFAFRALMFVAILVAVVTMISWINDSRAESDELPLS